MKHLPIEKSAIYSKYLYSKFRDTLFPLPQFQHSASTPSTVLNTPHRYSATPYTYWIHPIHVERRPISIEYSGVEHWATPYTFGIHPIRIERHNISVPIEYTPSVLSDTLSLMSYIKYPIERYPTPILNTPFPYWATSYCMYIYWVTSNTLSSIKLYTETFSPFPSTIYIYIGKWKRTLGGLNPRLLIPEDGTLIN